MHYSEQSGLSNTFLSNTISKLTFQLRLLRHRRVGLSAVLRSPLVHHRRHQSSGGEAGQGGRATQGHSVRFRRGGSAGETSVRGGDGGRGGGGAAPIGRQLEQGG